MRAAGRLVALFLTALAAGSGCARSPRFEVRKPFAPTPAAAPSPAALRVLHFGDFGARTRQQEAVARAMIAAHQRAPFDLAFSVGDNVYDCGPNATLAGADRCTFNPDGSTVDAAYQPPRDGLFEDRFEKSLRPLAEGTRAVPVHLVLGNHDVNASGTCSLGAGHPQVALARTRACLEVAHRSPEWQMPGRHYVLDRGPARFIAIDSNLLTGDYGGFTIGEEIEFVRSAAQGCASRLCFLVAHHPSVMAGSHVSDATPGYQARVAAIEAAAGDGIAAWLAGHDHDLQHLRSPSGYDVLVSGNTARGRSSERFRTVSDARAELLYASNQWGYGVLEVGAGGWAYRFENEQGTPVHCCVAAGRGPCQPVACSPR